MNKLFIIVLVLFLLIDIPVIAIINKKMYKIQFDRINNRSWNGSFFNTLIFGSIAYVLLAYGVTKFVIEDNDMSILDLFKKGFMFGIVVYGVYNATNKVTIDKWGIKESVVDTLWGGILCACLSIFARMIYKKIA